MAMVKYNHRVLTHGKFISSRNPFHSFYLSHTEYFLHLLSWIVASLLNSWALPSSLYGCDDFLFPMEHCRKQNKTKLWTKTRIRLVSWMLYAGDDNWHRRKNRKNYSIKYARLVRSLCTKRRYYLISYFDEPIRPKLAPLSYEYDVQI